MFVSPFKTFATIVCIIFSTHVGWPVSNHFVRWRVFDIASEMSRRECQAAPEEEFDFSIGLWHNWSPALATSTLYRHRVTYTHSMLNGWLSIHPPARSPANHHTQRRLLLVLDSGYPRVWLGYAGPFFYWNRSPINCSNLLVHASKKETTLASNKFRSRSFSSHEVGYERRHMTEHG